MNATALTIKIGHQSSIPGAYWCLPVGWEPSNQIDGAEFVDGSWWGLTEEEAGLVWFGVHPGQPGYSDDDVIVEATLDELRVAACGNCRVIGKVEL